MAFSNLTAIPPYNRVSASTGVISLLAADWLVIELDGTNGTLSLKDEQRSQEFYLELTQAASGGPYSPAYWSGITWLTADGSEPAMPSAAGATLILGFKCIGGGLYYGWVENASEGGGGGITALTGDVTASGPGSATATLASSTLQALAAANPTAIKAHRPVNAQTDTSYTFVLGDADQLVTSNNASAVAWTLPLHASVAFAVNVEIDLFNLGAGAVTLTPTSSATVNGSGSAIVINQWQGGTIKQLTTDAWIYIGSHA